jgi:hypothetical protein
VKLLFFEQKMADLFKMSETWSKLLKIETRETKELCIATLCQIVRLNMNIFELRNQQEFLKILGFPDSTDSF